MNREIQHFAELVADRCAAAPKSTSYAVPALWLPGGKKGAAVRIEPSRFYSDALRAIARQKATRPRPGKGGSWTNDAVIFNMFVRSTTAFDHNRNGRLDLPQNEGGWRETGTFLKAAAILPYIRGLGANTIHLLPITAIGSDGNKGTLGSPYAIKNPYHIDDRLAEPHLGLGVEEEFRMFVRCAHHLGLRVVVEFVFRTSSKDGDWVKEHPEWYYWIKANVADREPGSHAEDRYGNPLFTPEELKVIKTRVEAGDLDQLPPPHDIYRSMFTEPPHPSNIRLEQGRWIGTLPDGTRVRIPGAYADWPPDDTQPPWGDVTYLKMYDHPDFNYIAYNTIRMYDRRLARKENVNVSLWERIVEIVPHYQKEFGIDGVMIDMGHALPMELKQRMIHRARAIDPQFAFWDENFSISTKSVDEGYNAVIGYQWSDQHHPEKFRTMLRRFGDEGYPIAFFATPESHNTPRAAARPGGMRYSRYAWAISNFIPAVPFLHSGLELGEKFPINTGLDFTRDDLARFPSETLPLFSEGAYAWLNREECTAWVRAVSAVRLRHAKLITDRSPASFRWIETGNAVIAFLRTARRPAKSLLVLANSSMTSRTRADIEVATKKRALKNLLGTTSYPVRGTKLSVPLAPGEVLVFEL